MRILFLGLAAAACLVVAGAAHAGEMPKEVADAVNALGAVIDPPATAKLFASQQQTEPYQGVNVARDEKYGAADRNRLDVFTPAAVGEKRPVLMFVHGGGFVRGDKRPPGSPFYDNIMLWAAANGMVGVNITYRLAPAAPWPAGVEDVAAAVAWTRNNVARFGGDPDRIYLMGHSAGAVHVATYVAHPEFQKIAGGGLAGAILVSGIYQLAPDTGGAGEMAYFGEDTSTWNARSSMKGLVASKVPLLVMHAEIDPPIFIAQTEALRGALCTAQRCPAYVTLPRHSHMSEVYAINTADTRLTDPVLAFVRKGK